MSDIVSELRSASARIRDDAGMWTANAYSILFRKAATHIESLQSQMETERIDHEATVQRIKNENASLRDRMERVVRIPKE